MIHNVALLKKEGAQFIFYKDYWGLYKDYQSMLRMIAAYVPYIANKEIGAMKVLKNGDSYEFHFTNFNQFVIVFGTDIKTDRVMIRAFMKRLAELLNIIFEKEIHISTLKLPKEMQEFTTELEIMVRASPYYEALYKLDKTVEQRLNITPASEELNRRNGLIGEQAAMLIGEFFVEFQDENTLAWEPLGGTGKGKSVQDLARPKFYMTSNVALQADGKLQSETYEVFFNFREYPRPPKIQIPPKLEKILGSSNQLNKVLETLIDWDMVHPPTWLEVVRELEEKVYKSETHIIEPIVEEEAPQKGKKGKGMDEPTDQKKKSPDTYI
ncbi:MAG: hypothetical protein EAX96_14380 [Candidatus Lokiarchaeota archaeon]|nr:hypothetical protein [Candidatus Lokiarchaeota archaeon]